LSGRAGGDGAGLFYKYIIILINSNWHASCFSRDIQPARFRRNEPIPGPVRGYNVEDTDMKSKKMGLMLAAVATMMLTASLAMARQGGPAGPGGPGGAGGPGYGPCGGAYAQLSPEKQAALQKLQEAFFTKTVQLRADIGVKRAELNAVSVAATPDTAKIQALSKELGDLVGKLTAERVLFRAQVAKEIGPAGLAACPGFGPGFGRGHGYGHGGYGHMGRGGMMGY
jgi:zinc resistance-associated protein